MLFFLLKLMFRLRACTEEIPNFALFAEAFDANSYLWMFWLEQRRRNKQPLNSGDEFPNSFHQYLITIFNQLGRNVHDYYC